MMSKYPALGDVRGKGLWLAVEFVKDRRTKEKDHAFAAEVNRRCLENGLYLVSDSISCFVRIQPPVNIPAALFEQGLDILEDAIRVASGGAR
jgi:4-aminobutyrate aminotransferase